MSTRTQKLKEFYAKRQAAEVGNGNAAQDDMSKASFNSKKFFDNLVAKKSLNELMDFEAQLARETRKYDSDMQNLVMENYNKFIMATDTIGRMKNDFQDMEQKVLDLSERMNSINKNAQSIGKNLSPNRQKLADLVKIQDALSQLQYIFTLPKSLQNAIDNESSDNYDTAVNLYLNSKQVLKKYRNHTSFEKTAIHVDILVGKLESKIFEKIVKPGLTQPPEDHDQQTFLAKNIEYYIEMKSSQQLAIANIFETTKLQRDTVIYYYLIQSVLLFFTSLGKFNAKLIIAVCLKTVIVDLFFSSE